MTYYDILEVSPSASNEIIKSAYKGLSKKYHPDVYQGDYEEANRRMALINEAYEILSDPVKRKEYDALLFDDGEEDKKEAGTDNPFESNNSQAGDVPPSKDKKGCSGCLSTILGIAFWIVVIAFVIRACSTGEGSTNKNSQDTTQTQETITESTQEGWQRTPLFTGERTAFSVNLPEELATRISVEEKGVSAEYFSDNWGIYLITQVTEMDDLTDLDWTQTQIDSSYDGTAADLMFSMAVEEYYDTCILPSFSQMDTKPKVQYGQKRINGILWYVAAYTEEKGKNSGFDLEMTLYFCADNHAVTTFIVSKAYSVNDITWAEKATMNEWIRTISDSLLMERDIGEVADQGHTIPPATQPPETTQPSTTASQQTEPPVTTQPPTTAPQQTEPPATSQPPETEPPETEPPVIKPKNYVEMMITLPNNVDEMVVTKSGTVYYIKGNKLYSIENGKTTQLFDGETDYYVETTVAKMVERLKEGPSDYYWAGVDTYDVGECQDVLCFDSITLSDLGYDQNNDKVYVFGSTNIEQAPYINVYSHQIFSVTDMRSPIYSVFYGDMSATILREGHMLCERGLLVYSANRTGAIRIDPNTGIGTSYGDVFNMSYDYLSVKSDLYALGFGTMQRYDYSYATWISINLADGGINNAMAFCAHNNQVYYVTSTGICRLDASGTNRFKSVCVLNWTNLDFKDETPIGVISQFLFDDAGNVLFIDDTYCRVRKICFVE